MCSIPQSLGVDAESVSIFLGIRLPRPSNVMKADHHSTFLHIAVEGYPMFVSVGNNFLSAAHRKRSSKWLSTLLLGGRFASRRKSVSIFSVVSQYKFRLSCRSTQRIAPAVR
jgi:hypothetical protein